VGWNNAGRNLEWGLQVKDGVWHMASLFPHVCPSGTHMGHWGVLPVTLPSACLAPPIKPGRLGP
jgi:hypothetical protein